MDALIEFIKILVPASVVLYAMYLLVRMFIQREIDIKKLEVRGKCIETVLPNRLQAYERMTLFLERMSPQNLLMRLNVGGMPAREFHQLLLTEIRNEYNHNASQQIYIGEEVWNMIKNSKEDLKRMRSIKSASCFSSSKYPVAKQSAIRMLDTTTMMDLLICM